MNTLHDSTFSYLKPTDEQLATMEKCRDATHKYADAIDMLLPAGPDKTFILRTIRDAGMWANVTITRNPDGSPRQ